MSDPNVSRHPKPSILASPKSTPPKMTLTSDPSSVNDLIRERAYQLYENCGRENGNEEHDWLRAEQEVLSGHR